MRSYMPRNLVGVCIHPHSPPSTTTRATIDEFRKYLGTSCSNARPPGKVCSLTISLVQTTTRADRASEAMSYWLRKRARLSTGEEGQQPKSVAEHDPEQPCHIDSLPDELLARLILLLPWEERLRGVERVSKRWRRVSTKSGWSDFTVFDNQQSREHPNGVKLKQVIENLAPYTHSRAHTDNFRCSACSPDAVCTWWN